RPAVTVRLRSGRPAPRQLSSLRTDKRVSSRLEDVEPSGRSHAFEQARSGQPPAKPRDGSHDHMTDTVLRASDDVEDFVNGLGFFGTGGGGPISDGLELLLRELAEGRP